MSIPATVVNACCREGSGGSPTAVVDLTTGAEVDLADARCRLVPRRFGTSHAVFIRPAARRRDVPVGDVELRFFTSAGELPGCGHGTVAALAFLAGRRGAGEHEFRLRAGGRTFAGHASRSGATTRASFDPGPVTLSDPTPTELEPVIGALRVPADGLLAGSRIATLGRARLLVPVSSAAVVAALRPDSERLRAVCDQFGWLGCYVYSPPTSGGRVAARMFAPSIGVPEDVANANSTACLAVHLAGSGPVDITVDMGDSLHRPATITASLRPTPTGQRVLVGGAAVIGRTDD